MRRIRSLKGILIGSTVHHWPSWGVEICDPQCDEITIDDTLIVLRNELYSFNLILIIVSRYFLLLSSFKLYTLAGVLGFLCIIVCGMFLTTMQNHTFMREHTLLTCTWQIKVHALLQPRNTLRTSATELPSNCVQQLHVFNSYNRK